MGAVRRMHSICQKEWKNTWSIKRYKASISLQTLMSKAVLVKSGDKYLPGVQISELEEMYRCERPGKSRDSLQAAVLRKQGRMLETMAYTMGHGISTTHRWLFRMVREGPDGGHDGKSPGRPRLLSPRQEKVIEGYMDGTPRNSGFGRGSWNAKMISRHILEQFGVSYSNI